MTYPEDELAKRRALKHASLPAQSDYERREAQEYARQMREVEQGSLAERRESCANWSRAMAEDPHIVAERCGWLLDGNYGYGAMKAAQRVMVSHKGANKVATLSQMIAALEWQCPPRMAVAAWKKLSPAQKTRLQAAIKKEIERDI